MEGGQLFFTQISTPHHPRVSIQFSSLSLFTLYHLVNVSSFVFICHSVTSSMFEWWIQVWASMIPSTFFWITKLWKEMSFDSIFYFVKKKNRNRNLDAANKLISNSSTRTAYTDRPNQKSNIIYFKTMPFGHLHP